MFEKIRQSFNDLMASASSPEDRRAALHEMKETLVRARMGIDDLRGGLSVTRTKLAAERRELETVQRRKSLALGINDTETVAVAERFERQSQERVEVLARKLEAQEAELALAEREVAEMGSDLKAAMAGIPTGGQGRAGRASAPLGDAADDLLRDDLRGELDGLDRARGRAARDAEAAERLEALKRRMGK